MTTLLYAEIKLKADMKDEFLDLVNSPEGFPITKSKPGFISAETAISTDESGQNTFHLWEKWEKMEDFENLPSSPTFPKGETYVDRIHLLTLLFPQK